MAKVAFTVGRVRGFKCEPDKEQAFLWDSTAPGLGLRATPAGKPAYIVQSRLQGKTIRVTIGSPDAWSIPQAQEKARELQRQIDAGRDPREVKAETIAADTAKREDAKRQTATVAEAWAVYLAERRPHWGARTYIDHQKIGQTGGVPRTNRKNVKTIDGPLAVFMPLPLRSVDNAAVLNWAVKETLKRPARVRLALRLLKAFLRWCAAEPAYKDVTDAIAASGTKTREIAGKAKPKNDNLQREQLAPWFLAVRQIRNPVISAYLQCVLLTGRRREQVAYLRWEDVNFQWKTIAMKDKEEGETMVPLTPYMAHLMNGLPRRNGWVFSAPSAKSGRLTEPSIGHRQACAVAGLEGLTIHGLRRSFASLCEWLDIPGGISAQIQGHAPQGVREQNYIRRPLDLLRVHHVRIEAWILEQAGVTFDATASTPIRPTLAAIL